MIIFEAKCKQSGLFFKNFFDMLVQLSPVSNLQEKGSYIRQTCFKIYKEGIQIYTNINHSVWVSADYEASSFSPFCLKVNEINIGANLELIKNFFKNTKKQDDVVFKINADEHGNPTELEINIFKEKHDMILSNTINVQTVQSEHLDYDGRLHNPVHITSVEFTSLCRSIYPQPGWIDISFAPNCAKFHFNINDVAASSILIGDPEVNKFDFTERFNGIYIRNINKLATFSSYVKMYATIKQPLVFETKIGFIGTIRVWIKSNNQIIEEQR